MEELDFVERLYIGGLITDTEDYLEEDYLRSLFSHRGCYGETEEERKEKLQERLRLAGEKDIYFVIEENDYGFFKPEVMSDNLAKKLGKISFATEEKYYDYDKCCFECFKKNAERYGEIASEEEISELNNTTSRNASYHNELCEYWVCYYLDKIGYNEKELYYYRKWCNGGKLEQITSNGKFVKIAANRSFFNDPKRKVLVCPTKEKALNWLKNRYNIEIKESSNNIWSIYCNGVFVYEKYCYCGKIDIFKNASPSEKSLLYELVKYIYENKILPKDAVILPSADDIIQGACTWVEEYFSNMNLTKKDIDKAIYDLKRKLYDTRR